MIVLTIFLFVIFGTLASGFRKRKRLNQPPGTGNSCLVFLLKAFASPHLGKYLTSVGTARGPIAYAQFGPFKAILLNNAEIIREACRSPVLNGRIDCLQKDIMRQRGMFWPDDTTQKRKIVFRSSRHFGLGIKSEESSAHEEISKLFQHLDKSQGEAMSVKGVFNIPTFNVVAHRFLGEKYPHDDPGLTKVVDRLGIFIELPGPVLKACAFTPSLTRWVPGSLSGRNFMENFFRDFENIVGSLLEKHYQTRVPKQPRDLADALMDEVEAITDVNSPVHISQDPIRFMMLDMLLAAIETTGSMLEWITLYLAQYPKVQAQLQNEVDNVIGRERMTEMTDRPNMPYVQAFLQEMFRIAPVIPFGFHQALEDTIFRGYTIEKGTYVLENFYGVHMDPKLWENPEEFKPERFLSPGGEFIKSDQLFLFGSGKRSCVGEITARDQLFFYVTRIVQTYNITAEKTMESFDGNMALGYHAPEFKAKFTRRTEITC